MSFLQELHELISDVISIYANNSATFKNKNILKAHSGGKQALKVFECILDGKKVAVKIYKPIITHLIVHTIAITFLMNNIEKLNADFDDIPINLEIYMNAYKKYYVP